MAEDEQPPADNLESGAREESAHSSECEEVDAQDHEIEEQHFFVQGGGDQGRSGQQKRNKGSNRGRGGSRGGSAAGTGGNRRGGGSRGGSAAGTGGNRRGGGSRGGSGTGRGGNRRGGGSRGGSGTGRGGNRRGGGSPGSRGAPGRGGNRGGGVRGRGRTGSTAVGSANEFVWGEFDEDHEHPNSSTPFLGDHGPSATAMQLENPLDYLFLLLGDDFFQLLCTETNRYAHQKGFDDFHTSSAEIAAFVGLNIAMGIVNLPKLHDYWSTNPILQHPWFASVMSRNRFFSIQRFFHFTDNSVLASKGNPGYDKLGKIRNLLDRVSKTFPEHYSLSANVSIDEQMIGTKGRLSFLQYIPKKTHKWGIKLWVLADSSNGYVAAFEVYTGATEGVQHGLGYSVVMKLMAPYVGLWHRLYVDNFYTSPLLFHDLYKEKILACGTVRANRRGLPSSTERLSRGEAEFKKCGELTFVHWKDKRDVFCLSTFHSAQMAPITTRRGEVVQRPVLITDYNAFMGGVDRMDQMITYYSAGRKTIKWYKRLFWRVVDMALVNSYILYNLCHRDKPLTQKQFRLELADALVQKYINEKATGNVISRSPTERLRGKHFPITSKRGRCTVCGNKKNPHGRRRDRKTTNYCPKCKKHLCKKQCFELYHTRYRV